MKKTVFLDSSLRIAGGQQVLLELMSALHQRGIPVTAGVPHDSQLVTELERENIPWFHSPVRSASYQRSPGISYYTNFLMGLRQFYHVLKPETTGVVYANTFITALSAVIAGKLRKVPVVYYDHSLISHRFFSRIVSDYSAHILAVSSATARKYPLRHLEKLTILHNSVDTAAYSPGKSLLRKKLFGDMSCPIVGYVGRISSLKGVDLIPSIAKKIIGQNTRVHFWIVGDPFLQQDEGISEKIRDEIQINGLQNHVTVTRFQKNIVDVMRGIDILILPSTQESFGRVLIEAMAAGKPVIATRCGGPEEIITDGETGFLIPVHDSDALADKIILLLKNADLRTGMGMNGRARATRFFSFDTHVEKFLKIHESVMQQGLS